MVSLETVESGAQIGTLATWVALVIIQLTNRITSLGALTPCLSPTRLTRFCVLMGPDVRTRRERGVAKHVYSAVDHENEISGPREATTDDILL